MPKNLKPAKKKSFWQCSHLWIELMPWPRKEKKNTKQKPPFFVSPQHLPKVHTYENLFHHFHQPTFLTETKLPGTSSADSSARPMPWGSNKRNAWWLRQMDKESALPPTGPAGDGQLQWPCQGWNFPYSNWWSLECVGFKSPAVNGVLLHYQGALSDPFQGLSDLHWGDQKVTGRSWTTGSVTYGNVLGYPYAWCVFGWEVGRAQSHHVLSRVIQNSTAF